MKCIFIYNPNSGRGRIAKKLPYIVRRLKEKYERVDVYATKARGDLSSKVREIASEYDCIVFSGGDGTFNEVLQGAGDMDSLPDFGYIPGGTANDVAHSLGIPRRSLRGALNVILRGRRELLDCMCINGRDYAMYSVSAGAFTSASYTTPQEAKKALGLLAYGLEGVRKNFPLRIYPVRISEGENCLQTDCVFTLVMNGKCVAGWKMNRGGSMQDGKAEGAVVRQTAHPSIPGRVRALLSLVRLFVFGYKFPEKGVEHFGGKKFRIEVPDDVVWNYDGERGCSGSVEIEVLPRKFPLIVPENNKNI